MSPKCPLDVPRLSGRLGGLHVSGQMLASSDLSRICYANQKNADAARGALFHVGGQKREVIWVDDDHQELCQIARCHSQIALDETWETLRPSRAR